jgi:transposase-like protein
MELKMSVLSKPYFHDEEAAYAKLEAIIWPEGPVCPHCGCMGHVYKMTANAEKRIRIGLHKCGDCRKQFTVKVGTVFESSHVKLHLWFQAAYLLASSKKGISAHQLHRTLGVTYKTAWFMAHRLREAMATVGMGPLGGEGKIVESDETYIGRKKGSVKKAGGAGHKLAVLSLVERGGEVRSFHIERATKKNVREVIDANVNKESHLMTDMAGLYVRKDYGFAAHDTVDHSRGEYVRGAAYTNTLEGYFSLFKKGMKGVYQHCGEQHLHRYLAEFDFRYNARTALGVNDDQRADRALRGIAGKRLTYRRIGQSA